jgi:hypothetical protein
MSKMRAYRRSHVLLCWIRYINTWSRRVFIPKVVVYFAIQNLYLFIFQFRVDCAIACLNWRPYSLLNDSTGGNTPRQPRTNEATGRIVLSPNSAQKNACLAHASLIWNLKYTNLVPKFGTCVDALVWIESSMQAKRKLIGSDW